MRLKLAYLFSEHQISKGQLSADSSSTETLYCLISVQQLGIVDKIATFLRLSQVLKEH